MRTASTNAGRPNRRASTGGAYSAQAAIATAATAPAPAAAAGSKRSRGADSPVGYETRKAKADREYAASLAESSSKPAPSIPRRKRN